MKRTSMLAAAAALGAAAWAVHAQQPAAQSPVQGTSPARGCCCEMMGMMGGQGMQGGMMGSQGAQPGGMMGDRKPAPQGPSR